MQTPTNFNDQHTWGGQHYQPEDSQTVTVTNGYERATVAGRGQQDTGFRPLSQAGFVASNSDDLFHPTSGVPSSYVFNLPDVPHNPNPHYAYNRTRDLPHPSSFSSYNNPSFTIPPPHVLHNQTSPLNSESTDKFLGPPPPIPYHSRPQLTHFSQFENRQLEPQSAYIHSLPMYHQNQPIQNLIPRSSPSPTFLPFPPPRSGNLPTVSHIPLLTSKIDFPAWDEAVNGLIRANGLIGHILDPSTPVVPDRPDLASSPIPVLPAYPSTTEIAALNHWWNDDNVAQHILVSRLGSIPRGLLPPPNVVTRTALSIYRLLLEYYGTCNYNDCILLLNSLQNSTCTAGRVPEFVSKWRSGISRLHFARFVFNIKICVGLFVRGLPYIPAFNSIRSDLPERIAAIAHEQDYGAFIALTEKVLQLDTIFRSAPSSQLPRQPREPIAASSTQPTPVIPSSNVPDTPSRVLKNCNNCKSRGLRSIGHTDATCFQQGGGMEGRREEYLNNKGRVQAMLAECLENALLSPDQPLSSEFPSPPSSPPISGPPILDDEPVIPPIANLCVVPTTHNFDLRDDLYTPRPIKFTFPFAYASIDFKSVSLASMVSLYNALLDSGCTHHIVRDRHLFQSYSEKSISVGTANCGSLEALGTGDIEFRYPFGNQHVIFTLRGCLYAPSAPINLLSVGALVERGMSCLFSLGGITKVFYPENHGRLPGFTFSATVANRLSFLHLDFIPPVAPDLPVAFPAQARILSSLDVPVLSFPRLKQDSLLWHRRFGHIGMEATRAALKKDYVKGVHLEGAFIHNHCVPCIVGKSPQHSYSHNGHRASKVGELLHMDICGPYPVQAPRGEKYFFSILDDKSNWGFTFGIKLKSDAFSHYLTAEAFLERSHSIVVLAIRCGGELELTAGQMGNHLASKGIVVQRTVPYAHQQNGKSERYIRTIEEGGQALLADAGLPMSFWLDAVLTRQYLVNRLPTSTLPENITPFEVITSGRKPDLSHLRVWGCECYVAVPDELRGKAAPKRFRAIFVGYEEHRVGWRVRGVEGKYSFSNDVIFNENLSGRLGVPRPLLSPLPVISPSSSPRPLRDQPRARTLAGQAFDEVLRLKALRKMERDNKSSASFASVDGFAHGGAFVDRIIEVAAAANGGAPVESVSGGVNSLSDGGAEAQQLSSDIPDMSFYSHQGVSDLSPSTASIDYLSSLATSPPYDDQTDIVLFDRLDSELVFPTAAFASPSRFLPFDLSKAPVSYSEAVVRSDAPVWQAAMDREKQSLHDMGAFEEVELPVGEKTIGLKWVYDHKTDSEGKNIVGKEKARLVAQGFNQRPGQYDETYAPVAKMTSIRLLLA